jgi:hypothetical protein
LRHVGIIVAENADLRVFFLSMWCDLERTAPGSELRDRRIGSANGALISPIATIAAVTAARHTRCVRRPSSATAPPANSVGAAFAKE